MQKIKKQAILIFALAVFMALGIFVFSMEFTEVKKVSAATDLTFNYYLYQR